MASLKESVQRAIRIEKEAYDLYRLAGATVSDESKRDLLMKLAADVMKHLAIIEARVKKLSPTLCTYFDHFVPEVEFRLEGREGDSVLFEALEAALAKKRRLEEFYRDLSETAEDPEWRAMFKELAVAGKEHLEFVEKKRGLLGDFLA